MPKIKCTSIFEYTPLYKIILITSTIPTVNEFFLKLKTRYQSHINFYLLLFLVLVQSLKETLLTT